MLKKVQVVPPVDERGNVEVQGDVDSIKAGTTIRTACEFYMLKRFSRTANDIQFLKKASAFI
tara:strand:- start:345 stop:530 length:186 start_codon:yes stop_codon:yes gene_type:complete